MSREFPKLNENQLQRLSMVGEFSYFERAVENLIATSARSAT